MLFALLSGSHDPADIAAYAVRADVELAAFEPLRGVARGLGHEALACVTTKEERARGIVTEAYAGRGSRFAAWRVEGLVDWAEGCIAVVEVPEVVVDAPTLLSELPLPQTEMVTVY